MWFTMFFLVARVADLRLDCRRMLVRFDRECNTTHYDDAFRTRCDTLEFVREYRALYYKVQAEAQDCFIQ